MGESGTRFGRLFFAVSLREYQRRRRRVEGQDYPRKANAMATAQITGLEPDYSQASGALEITRRLSDKVLAAFNHAGDD